MGHSDPLILQAHLPGAEPYEIGDEIWQQPLADAIRAEAETIADHAGPGLLPLPGRAGRVAFRNHVLIEMTAALRQAGDTYTAPDGVAYTLSDSALLDLPAPDDRLAPMGRAQSAPIVEEVLRFEDLPLGSSATRAAVVRWSDGTESQTPGLVSRRCQSGPGVLRAAKPRRSPRLSRYRGAGRNIACRSAKRNRRHPPRRWRSRTAVGNPTRHRGMGVR